MKKKSVLMAMLWLLIVAVGMYISYFSTDTDGVAAGTILAITGVIGWMFEFIHLLN